METILKLPKVLNENGDLIDVNHSSVKRGLNPNLKCPDSFCNAPVTARKGKEKQAHFAHKPKDGCTGYESMLHLLAKEAVKKLKTFRLPNYTLYFYDLYPFFKTEIESFEEKLGFHIPEAVFLSYPFSHNLTDWEKAPIEVFSGCTMKLSQFKVFVEKPIKDMTPDLRFNLSNTDRNLHLEILVTHKIDEVKKKRLIERNLCFLELDLSDHFKDGKEITTKRVHEIFLKSEFRHNWIHFPKLEKFLKKNRESLLKEMFSRVKLLYHNYTLFTKEVLLSEVENFVDDSYYDNKLLVKLKDNKAKNLYLGHPDIFDLFVGVFKNSSEYRHRSQIIKTEKAAKRADFVSRWGEDVYKKIYGK